MAPTTCQAVVCPSAPASGEQPVRAQVQTVSVPQLRDGLVLVRVKAVALNPTDWKSVAMGQAAGTRIGCDYAGVVEAVAPGVSKSLEKGDRVCGMVSGANKDHPEMGAFGEYIVAKGDLQIKIPDNLGFEEAATLGVGISTVGQGLYQTLQLPFPSSPLATPIPILIYGGSTATGLLAIQFAKASGLQVLTTCSPRNFDYLRALGADHVYDYHGDVDLDALADEVKARTGNKLALAFDCSPTEASARFCARAMSDDPQEQGRAATYCAILRVDPAVVAAANPRVEARFTMAYTMFAEPFTRYGLEFPARPEDYAFGVRWWEASREALARGQVKPARREVNRTGPGFEGVVAGLDELKEGRVSGTKLVYTI